MKKQCYEFELLITDCVDGMIEEAAKREVFLHLAKCDSCRRFWDSILEMKLQVAKERQLIAPSTLDKRIKAIPIQNTLRLSVSNAWISFLQSRLSIPMPLAFLLVLSLLSGGTGIALLWPSTSSLKADVEPIVCLKLPTVEVRGNAPLQSSIVH